MIIAGFDLETTGFDGRRDHIVQYSFQIWNDGVRLLDETHLVNPGVAIENSDIHGVTDDMVMDAVSEYSALKSIWSLIYGCVAGDIPLAIMNARFDITFLLNRSKGLYFTGCINDQNLAMIDPYVIDKHIDKYRPGSRKLADLARHYGVVVDDDRLHDAGYDVELTVKLAIILLGKVGASPRFLHSCQSRWYDEQAKSLYDYFKSEGNEAYKDIRYGWPVAGRLIHDA